MCNIHTNHTQITCKSKVYITHAYNKRFQGKFMQIVSFIIKSFITYKTSWNTNQRYHFLSFKILHTETITFQNLQNDVAVILSAKARLFLLVIIPIEQLDKKMRIIKHIQIKIYPYSFSNKASVDFTRNESLGSSAFSFSVNTHTILASLLYLGKRKISLALGGLLHCVTLRKMNSTISYM